MKIKVCPFCGEMPEDCGDSVACLTSDCAMRQLGILKKRWNRRPRASRVGLVDKLRKDMHEFFLADPASVLRFAQSLVSKGWHK